MAKKVSVLKDTITIIWKNPAIYAFISLVLVLPAHILLICHGFIIIHFSKRLSLQSRSPAANLTDKEGGVIFKIAIELLITSSLISIVNFIMWCFYTSSLDYTTALLYTAPRKEISKKEALNLSPATFERLFITCLCAGAVYIGFTIDLGISFYVYTYSMKWLGVVLFLLLAVVVFYFNLVQRLSWVVSVLEDLQGMKPLNEGMRILKGHILLGIGLLILEGVLMIPAQKLCVRVVNGVDLGSVKWWEVIVIILLLTCTTVFYKVMYVMYYFLCKDRQEEITLTNQYVSLKLINEAV